MKVVLNGATNGGCGDCANADGTYYVPFYEIVGAGVCRWRYTGDLAANPSACGSDGIDIDMYYGLLAGNDILVQVRDRANVIWHYSFRLDGQSNVCSGYSNISIPPRVGDTLCHAGTCVVSAV